MVTKFFTYKITKCDVMGACILDDKLYHNFYWLDLCPSPWRNLLSYLPVWKLHLVLPRTFKKCLGFKDHKLTRYYSFHYLIIACIQYIVTLNICFILNIPEHFQLLSIPLTLEARNILKPAKSMDETILDNLFWPH